MMSANPAPNGTGKGGSSKALALAWFIEGIAVAMGLAIAAFAGIEGSDGGVITLTVATMPFCALAAIELTKIPLVRLAFRVRRRLWVLLAIVALLCVTAATFENFVFGFERGFNERIRAIEVADQHVRQLENARALAEAVLPGLNERREESERELAQLGKDIEASRAQAERDIGHAEHRDDDTQLREERAQLQAQLTDIEQTRLRAVNNEYARCHRDPRVCNLRALNETVSAINDKAAREHKAIQEKIERLDERERIQHDNATADEKAARERLTIELADKERQAKALHDTLDQIRSDITAAESAKLEGERSIDDATRTRDELIERSQLHRLSDIAFGNHEPPALERTKRFFVVTLAAIVALIGTVLATMQFAALYAAEARRRPLTNAIRGYFARRRRRIPILRDIAEEARQRNRLVRSLRAWIARRRRRVVRTVIREVPVDRLKIIYLPLNPSEEAVFEARREAGRTAA
jgi:hypothetical protein